MSNNNKNNNDSRISIDDYNKLTPIEKTRLRRQARRLKKKDPRGILGFAIILGVWLIIYNLIIPPGKSAFNLDMDDIIQYAFVFVLINIITLLILFMLTKGHNPHKKLLQGMIIGVFASFAILPLIPVILVGSCFVMMSGG